MLPHQWAPPPALRPELAAVVEAARAARDDGDLALALDAVARAVLSGDLTAAQAEALAALLGLAGACRPANDPASPRDASPASGGAKR